MLFVSGKIIINFIDFAEASAQNGVEDNNEKMMSLALLFRDA